MPEYEILRSRVTLRPIYRCMDCGVPGVGDAYAVEVEGPAPTKVEQLGPRRMPVGWASYTNGFRCPRCAK